MVATGRARSRAERVQCAHDFAVHELEAIRRAPCQREGPGSAYQPLAQNTCRLTDGNKASVCVCVCVCGRAESAHE